MRDKKLAASYENKPCAACNLPATEIDHLKNYAGNPDRDVELNTWALCRKCHTEKHQVGLVRFVEKYRLWDALKEKGFYYCHLGQCYRHEKF